MEENNYHGKLPILDGSAALRMGEATFWPEESMAGGTRWSAAGLAAVWAQENTRGSLYDAMRRKETYATSGPRIGVHFFGGWNFPSQLLEQTDWISFAQEQGVPMGAELPKRLADKPTLAVWAIRDPASGNLDCIQIIKGWVNASDAAQEKIFTVAWSGKRLPGPDGVLEPVGNTVDSANATYDNSIGSAQLSAIWSDPQFDPKQEAFYYARVIEIPTPRWTTFDAKTLGIEAPQPTSLQERAVTSAIWYTA